MGILQLNCKTNKKAYIGEKEEASIFCVTNIFR